MSVTEFSSLLGHFSTRAGAALHVPRPSAQVHRLTQQRKRTWDKQQAARASLRAFEMQLRVSRHTNCQLARDEL